MKRAAPWLAAALAMIAVLTVFWPGYMSWDSAYQWWQARHNQFSDAHPPLMAMLWQFTEFLQPGPGGLFALQQFILWSALAAFVSALPLKTPMRVATVLVIGLWPPLLGLSVHLWKDIWTLGGFAWAAALLAHEARHPALFLRVAALLAISFGCAFRHNAITGALPLLLWLAWRETRRWPHQTRPIAILGLAVLLSLTTVGLAGLPARDSRVESVDCIWSVAVLWDAAAVSLREGQVIVPPELAGPQLDLAYLRQHFAEYTNTTVFEGGQLRHSLEAPYTLEQRAALFRLTWSLPFQHTAGWAAHRARFTALMYGWDQAALPDYQVLMPGIQPFGDNPRVAAPSGRVHDLMLSSLFALIDTPLFAGWNYLVLAMTWMVLGMLAIRHTEAAGLAATLATSALAYALPLAFFAGSADFRYLTWSIWATLAAMALWRPAVFVEREADTAPSKFSPEVVQKTQASGHRQHIARRIDPPTAPLRNCVTSHVARRSTDGIHRRPYEPLERSR